MRTFGKINCIVTMLTMITFLCAWAQNAGDYRSKASGMWNDAATWQTYDGSAWVDATGAPDGSAGTTITIQAGHTVEDTVALTINSGCTVIVDGYLKVTKGGITAPTSAPFSFVFNDGSTYEHAMAGGAIPMSTWNVGSTCLVTGTTSASPGNAAQNFYHFTWNCPGQTSNLNLAWDNVVIGGNLTCIASGSGTTQLRLTSAATVRNIRINGDVIVKGGLLTVSGSSGPAYYKVIVGGNIKLQGGTLNLCGGSGGVAEWYLQGDSLSIYPGATFSAPSSNNKVATRLIFAKRNGTQYYVNLGTNNNPSFGVDSGATVVLGSPLIIGSTGGLELRDGKFVTSQTNYLRCDSMIYGRITVTSASSITYQGVSVDASSNGGYIEGPFVFYQAKATKIDTLPLGRNGMYRPAILMVTQNGTTSTPYTAELITENLPTNTLPEALDAVNSKWMLKITKGSGANVTSAQLTLSYGAVDDNVSNNSEMRVAMDDGAGNWVNLGGSGTAPNTGVITSDVFTSLTNNYFTLAHVNPASIPSPPTVVTSPVTFISATFATSGGNVVNSGNAAVTERGVCWSTVSNPTVNDSKLMDEGTGSGAYVLKITGLTPGTTYYLRAYAINAAGVGYGEEVSFTTLAEVVTPTVTTDSVTSIVYKTAKVYGTVTDWGGADVTERGVCWSTNHNPTLEDEYNTAGSGLGSFTVNIGGLSLSKTYYVRAYAKNSVGVSYGQEIAFTTPAPQPDVYRVVDKNGTPGVNCHYTTVQAAFNDVPMNYTGRWIIYVRKGVYYEKLLLPAGKINVLLIGEDRDSTILTYDDYSGKNAGSTGTSTSYSVAIDASDFEAQNITFRNTANAYAPGSTASQAVALRTNGDRMEFYNCAMLGYQDTYYTWSAGRSYHKNCYIEGAVDFIFGRGVAVFDSCTIYCNRNGGVLTAAATDPGYKFGYVFMNSRIESTPVGQKGCDSNAMVSFYLGRPWQQEPQTVFLNCYEPATLNSAGWTVMGPAAKLFAEYNCYGPGAVTSPRPIIWQTTSQPSLLTSEQANLYTLVNIFSKTTAPIPYSENWSPQQDSIDFSQIEAIIGTPTKIESSSDVPTHFSLSQNYPNPFNPTTSIRFSLEKNGWVTLKVYDLLGREVATLVNEYRNAGTEYQVTFDGSTLSSGMYFYKLVCGEHTLVRKMVLMK